MNLLFFRKGRFWLMLIERVPAHYIKAELPCMKGEIVMTIIFRSIVIGWENKPV